MHRADDDLEREPNGQRRQRLQVAKRSARQPSEGYREQVREACLGEQQPELGGVHARVEAK